MGLLNAITLVELMSKNPILDSRAKHINIRQHFLRDHLQNGDIMLEFVCIKNQLADIFTKLVCDEHIVGHSALKACNCTIFY